MKSKQTINVRDIPAHIIERAEGFYAVVAGAEFGTYSTRGAAAACVDVERRRALTRALKPFAGVNQGARP